MSEHRIEASVGIGGKNRKKDVARVQDLLNKYILEGLLGPISFLDDGDASPASDTVHAIREFQSRVMKVPPTGRIASAYDDIYLSLLKTPKDNEVLRTVESFVNKWAKENPPGEIARDLWTSAMQSLLVHASHPRLKRYSMMTLVDYRIPCNFPRLWVVDLLDMKIHIHTCVAHGKGSVGMDEEGEDPINAVEFNFSSPYSSRLGAYIALNHSNVLAGQTKKDKKLGVRGPGVRVQGLDESNRMASSIGILFHGAHYVKPGVRVGTSRGCFATSFQDNRRIHDLIVNGSFVYAYAGEAIKPLASN